MRFEQPGKYKIVAMYSNLGQMVQFTLNEKVTADCKLPVDTSKGFPLQQYPDWVVWHIWNKAECGEMEFPQVGRQLLTLHYKKGNNLAYFDFVAEEK